MNYVATSGFAGHSGGDLVAFGQRFDEFLSAMARFVVSTDVRRKHRFDACRQPGATGGVATARGVYRQPARPDDRLAGAVEVIRCRVEGAAGDAHFPRGERRRGANCRASRRVDAAISCGADERALAAESRPAAAPRGQQDRLFALAVEISEKADQIREINDRILQSSELRRTRD